MYLQYTSRVCKTCVYLAQLSEMSENAGECRRHTPVVKESTDRASWPRVLLDEWCGEWVFKGAPKDIPKPVTPLVGFGIRGAKLSDFGQNSDEC